VKTKGSLGKAQCRGTIRSLDSMKKPIMMSSGMRTTVTIEPDTEALLREEMKRSGESFKKVLNRSIRRGLARQDVTGRGKARVEPLFDVPFPSEWLGGSMNRVANELDDEETLREMAK
jgi:hypothetical protein